MRPAVNPTLTVVLELPGGETREIEAASVSFASGGRRRLTVTNAGTDERFLVSVCSEPAGDDPVAVITVIPAAGNWVYLGLWPHR